jgi:hypothetical protein
VYTATPGKELILYRQLGHPRLGEILALPVTSGQQNEDEETLKMKKTSSPTRNLIKRDVPDTAFDILALVSSNR